MTIELESLLEDNPDITGELLRDRFFAQNRTGPNFSFGCYSTFKLRDDVENLPPRPVPEISFDANDELILQDDVNQLFTCAKKDDITMLYYWDGDGFLSFLFPDGRYLINSDCKKSYNWSLHESWNSYWKFAD